MRLMVLVAAGLMATTAAKAEVADYCAAYARDFADLVSKQDSAWQTRYDNSEKSCLTRFSGVEQAQPAKQKPRQQKALSQKPPRSPAPPPEKPVAEQKQKSGKLEPGTPEWNDYCTKKYVSFDAAKGTYLSKTGVERKCLVTPDAPALNATAKAPAKPKAKPPAKR